MMLFEDLFPNDQFLFQHPPHELMAAMGAECSEGHRGKVSMNCGDIGEAGLSTPKCAAGSVPKGLETTPKGKGKGKGNAREEEEEEEFMEPIQDTFTNKKLASLLQWRKALTVVNTGIGAGVEEGKGKDDNVN
ncbi:hypothetical protein C0989_000282 [Termitomyces sp. Mn162]|nr:hypothetical protein C0989_000282 [Termitomyces sp. Mn162]